METTERDESPDVVTFHLDVRITMKRNGEPVQRLLERLGRIVDHAHEEGVYTGDSEAELVSLAYSLIEVKPSTQ